MNYTTSAALQVVVTAYLDAVIIRLQIGTSSYEDSIRDTMTCTAQNILIYNTEDPYFEYI